MPSSRGAGGNGGDGGDDTSVRHKVKDAVHTRTSHAIASKISGTLSEMRTRTHDLNPNVTTASLTAMLRTGRHRCGLI